MKSSTSSRTLTMEQRQARGERQRKWFFVALAFQQAQVLALIVLVLILYAGRAESREYYNNQIRDLVCSVPPRDETSMLLRERAQCGPYVAPSRPGGAPRPSVSRTPRPTVTVTGEANLAPTRPTASGRASSTPQPTRRARPAVTPRPTSTTTRVVTRPPVTRTATPTPTGTQGLLPGLLCTLLGCD